MTGVSGIRHHRVVAKSAAQEGCKASKCLTKILKTHMMSPDTCYSKLAANAAFESTQGTAKMYASESFQGASDNSKYQIYKGHT